MDVHDNARTTRHSRMLMVQRLTDEWSVAALAQALGVTPKTVRKWRHRLANEGEAGFAGLVAAHHSPRKLSEPAEETIMALRRQRLTGPPLPGASTRRSHRPE